MSRMIKVVVTIVTLVFSMAGLVAQAKPSFAGKWALADDAAAGIMGLGSAFTAAQDERTLTVTPTIHEVHVGERPEGLRAVYNLDGSESRNPLPYGGGGVINRDSKVQWDGVKLVITTRTTRDANDWTRIQTWSLDPSGTLTVDEIATSRGSSTTRRATYKRN